MCAQLKSKNSSSAQPKTTAVQGACRCSRAGLPSMFAMSISHSGAQIAILRILR